MADRRGGLPLWEQEHGRIRGRCRECGANVKPPRRWWCSQDCVDAHRIRTDPNFQRLSVFNRDRGVCAECGRDCVALRKDLRPLMLYKSYAVTLLGIVKELGGIPESWRGRHGDAKADAIERACKVVIDLGLLKQIGRRDTYWDMDHVTPLWEGGTNEIKNLRTLCIPCHREATRTGAKQRSQRRQRDDDE